MYPMLPPGFLIQSFFFNCDIFVSLYSPVTKSEAVIQLQSGSFTTHQNKEKNLWLFADSSLTVKKFSLTLQTDYFGHESTKIKIAQIIPKPKLPYLYENN